MSTFSEDLNIVFGAPQRSILEPLLFLIFIADLFYSNYNLYFAGFAMTLLPILVDKTLAALLKFWNQI